MNKSKQYDILAIILISFPLLIFITFRGLGTTVDTGGYYQGAADIYNGKTGLAFEYSFIIISKFLTGVFGLDTGFRGVLFFYGFLSFILLVFISCKYSASPFITFCIYLSFFFLMHLVGIIRAALAALIFLWATEDIINKNPGKYYLKSCLCFFFHSSGILAFFVYPFAFFIKNKKFLLFILPVIGYFLSKYFLLFLLLITKNVSHDNSYILNKLSVYSTGVSKGFISNINVFNIYFILVMFIYYFTFLIYKKLNNRMKTYHSILGLSVFTVFLGTSIPVFAYRIPELLNPVLILYIPGLYKYVKEKYLLTLAIVFLTIFMLYYWTIRHPLLIFK